MVNNWTIKIVYNGQKWFWMVNNGQSWFMVNNDAPGNCWPLTIVETSSSPLYGWEEMICHCCWHNPVIVLTCFNQGSCFPTLLFVGIALFTHSIPVYSTVIACSRSCSCISLLLVVDAIVGTLMLGLYLITTWDIPLYRITVADMPSLSLGSYPVVAGFQRRDIPIF